MFLKFLKKIFKRKPTIETLTIQEISKPEIISETSTVSKIFIHTDGAWDSRIGNSIAVIFYDENGQILYKFSKRIGITSPNGPSYIAIIYALGLCSQFQNKEITIYSHQEFIVNQLNGKYKVGRNFFPLQIIAELLIRYLTVNLNNKIKIEFKRKREILEVHNLAETTLRHENI
jgi:ribonuclease HI